MRFALLTSAQVLSPALPARPASASASAGTQYANGITAAAGLTDVALASRFNATNDLWVNSNGTDVLQHTIRGERID